MHTRRHSHDADYDTGRCRAVPVLAALVVVVTCAHAAAASKTFVDDCRQLTLDPHRLTGTAEYGRAAEHIEQRLREIGPDELVVQEFGAAQTEVLRCEITVGGTPLALLPMRPNGIIPPVTGPDGITGPIYRAGAGELGVYQDRSPQGCIVVLDYNAGHAWLRAFRLGAKAVIFTPSGAAESWRTHFVEANANFPRFYFEGPAAGLPDGATATIHSRIVWQTVPGRNVLAFFRGTDPKYQLEKDELIVVAANLDSFGEIPRRSPGARGAVNCAALLKLAEYFKANPPRRHVLLAFVDGQARGHTGVAALCRAFQTADLDAREGHHKDEHAFLTELQTVLQHPEPMEQDSRELLYRLKQVAADHATEVAEVLYAWRRQRPEDEAAAAAESPWGKHLQDIEQRKGVWNDLRRALAHRELTEHVDAVLQISLDEVRGNVAKRLEELAFEQRVLESARRAEELVAPCAYTLHVSLMLGDSTTRWGVAIGGNSAVRSGKDNSGLYDNVHGAFDDAWQDLDAVGRAPQGFELGSVDGTLNPPDVLWSGPWLIHSGAVVGTLGIYNVALCTAQENAARQGTPDDTLEALDLDRFEQQVSEIGPLLVTLSGQRRLSQISSIESKPQYVTPTFASGRAQGPMAMTRSRGGAVSTPLAGATVQLYHGGPGGAFRPNKVPGFDNFQVVRTNLNGSYASGPYHQWMPLSFGAGFDADGQVHYATNESSTSGTATRLNLFRCRPGALVVPPQVTVDNPSLMNADTDAPVNAERSHRRPGGPDHGSW